MEDEIKSILNLLRPGHTALIKYDVMTPALAFLILALEHYYTEKRYFVFWNKLTAKKVRNFVQAYEPIQKFFNDAEIIVVGDVEMPLGRVNRVEPSEDVEDLIDKIFDLISRGRGVIFNFGLHYLRCFDEKGMLKGLINWLGDMEKHINYIFMPSRFIEYKNGFLLENLPDLTIHLKVPSAELIFDKSTYQFEIRHSLIPGLLPTCFSFIVKDDLSLE